MSKYFDGKTGRILDGIEDRSQVNQLITEEHRLARLSEEGLRVALGKTKASIGGPRRPRALRNREIRVNRERDAREKALEDSEARADEDLELQEAAAAQAAAEQQARRRELEDERIRERDEADAKRRAEEGQNDPDAEAPEHDAPVPGEGPGGGPPDPAEDPDAYVDGVRKDTSDEGASPPNADAEGSTP